MAGGLGEETIDPGPGPCPEGLLLELDSAILYLIVRVYNSIRFSGGQWPVVMR
jgi:hypothetical protein